ncbi:hypothetical protein EJ08DRAFT_651631 [Tothia fuscella]|uniref:Uncharacterized protein n=1 Tax=Tothia fuscella TaxID=1048955 RepID=A0A9P4NLE8_9PEZI|nr:hypothetical protein EJ08DRAFT_651631 [Tothia fuscella]
MIFVWGFGHVLSARKSISTYIGEELNRYRLSTPTALFTNAIPSDARLVEYAHFVHPSNWSLVFFEDKDEQPCSPACWVPFSLSGFVDEQSALFFGGSKKAIFGRDPASVKYRAAWKRIFECLSRSGCRPIQLVKRRQSSFSGTCEGEHKRRRKNERKISTDEEARNFVVTESTTPPGSPLTRQPFHPRVEGTSDVALAEKVGRKSINVTSGRLPAIGDECQISECDCGRCREAVDTMFPYCHKVQTEQHIEERMALGTGAT